MLKSVIIASLFVSSAAFALPYHKSLSTVPGGDPRTQVGVILDNVEFGALGVSDQSLLLRVSNAVEYYESLSKKTNSRAVYAQAEQVLKAILSGDLAANTGVSTFEDTIVRLASDIPGKRKMETRGFEDDWSDLKPVQPTPAPQPKDAKLIKVNGVGDNMPADMPHGPHSFNIVVKPAPIEGVIRPDRPVIGTTDDFGGVPPRLRRP